MEEKVIKKRLLHCSGAGREREKRKVNDSAWALSYSSGGMQRGVGDSHFGRLRAMLLFTAFFFFFF